MSKFYFPNFVIAAYSEYPHHPYSIGVKIVVQMFS